jgi:serine/threonine protein phosphatase PrpC
MFYSLVDHNRSYQITGLDLLTSVVTGLSGAPYAIRHHQLSEVDGGYKWGHRLVALIEFVPVLGAAVALVERAVYALFTSGYSDATWQKAHLPEHIAMDRMKGTGLGAAGLQGGGAIKAIERAWEDTSTAPLSCTHQFADAIGPRAQMEDAHFYEEMKGGVLAGVFDGHGGKEVSQFASAEFEKRFPGALKEADGNVYNAFQTLIHHIQQDIARNSSWNSQGSTAVVCYIDTKKRLIYTATLGDSEANIYRNNLIGSVTSIPLSIVHNWSSEARRLIAVFGERYRNVIELLSMYQGGKHLRSRVFTGVNVSRAFGDVDQTGVPKKPLVMHEPSITVSKLREKDVVILACDGLKDYVEDREIAKTVGKTQSLAGAVFGRDERSLPKQLVHKALLKMQEEGHGDNVTVLAIQVGGVDGA